MTAERLRIYRLTPWGMPGFVVSANTAVYAPLAYLPAAAALGIARQAGLGPYDAILAARLANAAVYLALGLAALMVARRGRAFLALALLLPMALSLGGSCSQDGILLGVTAFCAACLTWPLSPRAFWAAAGLMAVLVLAKPPYLPLTGLMALHAGAWRRGWAPSRWRRCRASHGPSTPRPRQARRCGTWAPLSLRVRCGRAHRTHLPGDGPRRAARGGAARALGGGHAPGSRRLGRGRAPGDADDRPARQG